MKLDNVVDVLKYNKVDNANLYGGYIQSNKFVSQLWESSKDYKSFVDELLKRDFFDENLVEEDMMGTDDSGRWLYAYFSKKSPDHWYRIRSVFSKKQFKTYSDIGSLLINNNTLIHNGCGDGVTRVAIFKKDDEDYRGTEFFDSMMQSSLVSFSGKLDIYDYDIKGEGSVIMTIDGDYFVYTYEGLIALVEF